MIWKATTIEQSLKQLITGFYKLVYIKPHNESHTVRFVEFAISSNGTPTFSLNSRTFNLTQILRDITISEILSKTEEKEQLQLDESFLTDEQIERLDMLRNTQERERWDFQVLKECRIEWANQFKIGDRVKFNGSIGIISFKHEMKSNDSPQEWSVRSCGVEYRYVGGNLLSKHKKEDLSMIKIDKELDKLSTLKLLKMYKSSLKRGKGVGNKRIKRILYEREDIQNRDVVKVVNYR